MLLLCQDIQIFFNILAGLPLATTPGGMLFVTIEPFAMTESLPIVTPLSIFTFDPIKTFSSIITSEAS
jgi:hypothetical protein